MPFRNKLYYVVRVENLPSVLKLGILSNHSCEDEHINHMSFALDTVQEKRESKEVPNGLSLHEYANLYFDARNPAMFYLKKNSEHFERLCVLVLDGESTLSIPGAVVSDMNAACGVAGFYAANDLTALNMERIYAPSWIHGGDNMETFRHKHEKLAEALIPHKIDPKHFIGIYAQSDKMEAEIKALGCTLKVKVYPNIFFL